MEITCFLRWTSASEFCGFVCTTPGGNWQLPAFKCIIQDSQDHLQPLFFLLPVYPHGWAHKAFVIAWLRAHMTYTCFAYLILNPIISHNDSPFSISLSLAVCFCNFRAPLCDWFGVLGPQGLQISTGGGHKRPTLIMSIMSIHKKKENRKEKHNLYA